ncbi:Gfo/Idh/MocA family protein [Arsenicibacter rosenii]|uniref:Oxidoreductase n=1 Tax=Arsenicibacter rosenii TaxID=1750698 RepID=A0A1S2VCL1_9BACT|nr:Gfo/Idh/MocA family oxidoreductase [Arsenicibacter rosenii]OIN55668.1 oxidoreductase [Arsenicibacter rosenii]
MIQKENRLLRTGILGCGPIAQFAHFEACQKARNVELYALCDAAPDLLSRMSTIWQPVKSFSDYDQMLADPELECVIIATSDAFHLAAARKAVDAGKHVLVEKPVGTSLPACYALQDLAVRKDVKVQVGHMKRFDPGILHAHRFLREKVGQVLSYSGWYMDSTHRYTVTDNVQPLPVLSSRALKPGFDEKADKTRYYLLAHGSHLLDTAHYLAGEIGSIETRLVHRFGAWCWSMHVDFKNGAVGHLNLTVPYRGDWNEGFTVSGEYGSVEGKTYNPWYFRGSEVKCFLDKTATYEQVLGADAHFYRLQLEGLADTILQGSPQIGTDMAEGILNIKAMLAVQQSVRDKKRVYLDTIQEGEL